MTQAAFGVAPFSATVDLWLDCEHGRIALSQVGATFVMPASPQQLPPCRATVVVRVDGRDFPRPVVLVNGMNPADPDAAIMADDDQGEAELPF